MSYCFYKAATRKFSLHMQASAVDMLLWGRSSVGRALEWHSRGRRFDPVRLHDFLVVKPLVFLS